MEQDFSIFCPQCGYKNALKNKFCINCGMRVQATTAANIDQPVEIDDHGYVSRVGHGSIDWGDGISADGHAPMYPIQGGTGDRSTDTSEQLVFEGAGASPAQTYAPEPPLLREAGTDPAQAYAPEPPHPDPTTIAPEFMYRQPGQFQPIREEWANPGQEPPANANRGNSGFSIASMVCGIVALLLCCCQPLVSIIVAIVAIALGAIAIFNHYEGRSMAIAGLVMGIIFLILCVLVVAALGVTGIISAINEGSYY